MEQHKFERIDKGQPRDTRQPRTDEGKFLPVCSVEKRQEIIADAISALETGETTDQIAARYSIDGSTLRRWLLGDELLEDTANKSRKRYFDGELSVAREEIRSADTPFTLARAREDFRAVSWLAERRLPQFYGQKQEVTHRAPDGPVISIVLASALPTPKPIEGEYSMESVTPLNPPVT